MKIEWRFLAVLAAALAAVGCSSGPDETLAQAGVREDEAAELGRRDMVVLSGEALGRARIELGTASMAELGAGLSAPAEIVLNPDRTARIASLVEGVVTSCCKSVGDSVKQGEVLVELHTHRTHDLIAKYRQALALVDSREAELAYARQARARASRLHELRAGPLQQLQQTEAALTSAERAVDAANAELGGVLADFDYLGIDTSALERGRIPEHLTVQIRSPINGVVVGRSVSLGRVVQTSEELYTVSDMGSVWVMARVPQERLGDLRPGMQVNVRVKAYPDRVFQGRLDRIGDELDPATRTVQARCVLSNPGRALKDKMYADVEFRASGARRTLAVPERALQMLDGETIVFVFDREGVFRVRSVAVGGVRNGLTEILDGLAEGERIAVTGAFTLKSELLKHEFAEEE